MNKVYTLYLEFYVNINRMTNNKNIKLTLVMASLFEAIGNIEEIILYVILYSPAAVLRAVQCRLHHHGEGSQVGLHLYLRGKSTSSPS